MQYNCVSTCSTTALKRQYIALMLHSVVPKIVEFSYSETNSLTLFVYSSGKLI